MIERGFTRFSWQKPNYWNCDCLYQQTMALEAAVDSNQSLEDNLRMSADYYSAISRAALRLRGAVDGAKSQLAELES